MDQSDLQCSNVADFQDNCFRRTFDFRNLFFRRTFINFISSLTYSTQGIKRWWQLLTRNGKHGPFESHFSSSMSPSGEAFFSRRKYVQQNFLTVRALIGFKFLRYSVMVCEPRNSFWLCTTEILRELVSKSNIERQASRWMGLTSLHGPANFFP